MTELLKQDQYRPMAVEDQVVVIFAGVNGYLDGIAPSAVTRYEQAMLAAVRDKGADMLADIRSSGALSDGRRTSSRPFSMISPDRSRPDRAS